MHKYIFGFENFDGSIYFDWCMGKLSMMGFSLIIVLFCVAGWACFEWSHEEAFQKLQEMVQVLGQEKQFMVRGFSLNFN